MATYSSVIIGDTPLAYYRMDTTSGTEPDVSTAGLGPALTYGSSITRGATGLLTNDGDTAAAFPGTTHTVITSSTQTCIGARSTQLEPAGSTIAIECLISFSAFDTASIARIVHYGQGAVPNYRLRTDNTNTNAQFAWGVQTAAGVTSCLSDGPNVGFIPVTGQVVHMVCRYTGAILDIWANGVCIAQGPLTGAMVYTSPTLGLGVGCAPDSVASGTDDAFPGKIDEVSIWTSLTPAKIASHFEAAFASGLIGVAPSSGSGTSLSPPRVRRFKHN